jgi:hypothetical protein
MGRARGRSRCKAARKRLSSNPIYGAEVFEKATGRWLTEKFKGNELIRTAFGSTFDQAMGNTTMDGPEPDER